MLTYADAQTQRVMAALSDLETPLHSLPKKQRVALAGDMADVIRGCTIPEWVVLRATSKHQRRRARALAAEQVTREEHSSAQQQQEEAAAAAASAGRVPVVQEGAAAGWGGKPMGDGGAEAAAAVADDEEEALGTRFVMPDVVFDPTGTEDDAAWPGHAQDAVAPPWLGWEAWDWEARTWGPEMERDAEPLVSDHDNELTDDALRALVTNEKLMLAVESVDFELVEALVRAGANVDFYDAEFSKCCPMHLAAMQDDTEMLQTLLELGAHVGVLDGHYATPLHRAAGCGLEAQVELLVGAGANVSARDAQGRPPLHLAAGWGHADMVALLVRLGANVSCKTDLGDTALHAAAAWGRFDAAEALLDAGADPSVTNMLLVTPLDLAREYNYSRLAALLLARGAEDVDRTNARWDDMWADLEQAAAAGELGSSHGAFNSSHVREDFAAIHAHIEEMKQEKGPHGAYLRLFDQYQKILGELHIPEPQTQEDEAALMRVRGRGRARGRYSVCLFY